MSENLTYHKAFKAEVFALTPKGFMDPVRTQAWSALKYTTPMLEADVEEGGYGLQTHPRQARELLKLDTEAHRRRAYEEATTLQNLMGGNLSSQLCSSVQALQRLIAQGTEDEELYGERTARVYREREQELRRLSNNPAAIYYPR